MGRSIHSNVGDSMIPSSATSAINQLIANHALCRDCIARHAAIRPDDVDAALIVLSRTVKRVDRYAHGMCLECGRERLVFAIDYPPR
jgi:hypothetical protein